jgi:hypothetical protein
MKNDRERERDERKIDYALQQRVLHKLMFLLLLLLWLLEVHSGSGSILLLLRLLLLRWRLGLFVL